MDLKQEHIDFLKAPTEFSIGPLYVYSEANRSMTDLLNELSLIEPVPGYCFISYTGDSRDTKDGGTLQILRGVYRLTDRGQKLLTDKA